MAKAFNGWVESDVAIEIIGKMIAEVSKQLDELSYAYELAGFDEEELRQESQGYRDLLSKFDTYNKEIDSIHSGVNLDVIFRNVQQEYAPYIRERYNSLVTH